MANRAAAIGRRARRGIARLWSGPRRRCTLVAVERRGCDRRDSRRTETFGQGGVTVGRPCQNSASRSGDHAQHAPQQRDINVCFKIRLSEEDNPILFGRTLRIGAVPGGFDGLLIAALLATVLDAGTTFWFLRSGVGFETNPVLAPLAQRSLIWVPIYIIAPKLILLMMKKVFRDPFALFFLITGLLLSINNLDGIFNKRFFIVDTFGLAGVLTAGFICAAGWFFVRLAREPRKLLTIACALAWGGFFGLVEVGFLLAAHLL